jgi:hypothetical protein
MHFDRKLVTVMFSKRAMVCVCGLREAATELGTAVNEIIRWRVEEQGRPVEEGEVKSLIQGMRNLWFVNDVFS